MQAITIDNALYAEALEYAQDKGISLTALIERYLKRIVGVRTREREKERILKEFDHALKDFRLIQEGKLQTRAGYLDEDLRSEERAEKSRTDFHISSEDLVLSPEILKPVKDIAPLPQDFDFKKARHDYIMQKYG